MTTRDCSPSTSNNSHPRLASVPLMSPITLVRLLVCLFASLLILSPVPAKAATVRNTVIDRVGVRALTVHNPEREAPLTVTLWYPADAIEKTDALATTSELVGDNAVFHGISAYRNAPIASGRFPLVLTMHGGLRSAPHLGNWIAARLASHGFVVATINSVGAAISELWLRPADLSATLTAIEQRPETASQLLPGKVGVLGFFRGGSAALALAGARFDAQSYARSCDTGQVGLDCKWYKQSGIDLHQIDPASIARSHLDRRVRAVVAIEPELSRHFTMTSLESITIPLQVVTLGPLATRLEDMDASRLQAGIADLRYSEFGAATRFDAFPVCKPRGTAILREDGGDEAICARGDGPSRSEIHARLAELADAFFREKL